MRKPGALSKELTLPHGFPEDKNQDQEQLCSGPAAAANSLLRLPRPCSLRLAFNKNIKYKRQK